MITAIPPLAPKPMASVLDIAIALAKLGFALHWLQPPEQGGKAPIRCGWQKVPWQSPRDLRLSYREGMNLGIRTGFVAGARTCVVVLDLDSAEELAWARANMPASPVTVVTRRGEHWYYRYPGHGCIVPTRHRPDGRALDVNAQLAQVVCPPSVHNSGHIYRWTSQDLPTAVRGMCEWDPNWFRPAPSTGAPKVTSVPAYDDQGRAYRRGRGFARNWRLASEHEGRGTQTYLLAITLVKGLRLDGETAYQIMAHEWNPRLAEPYTEPLLRRKVAEAQKAQHATQQL